MQCGSRSTCRGGRSHYDVNKLPAEASDGLPSFFRKWHRSRATRGSDAASELRPNADTHGHGTTSPASSDSEFVAFQSH